jgi:hypothetical protein
MEGRAAFFRGLVVGVLLMMVLRSVVWLLTPSEHLDATTGRYVLNLVNILACGATAWSTAKVNEQLATKLDDLLTRLARLPAAIRRK